MTVLLLRLHLYRSKSVLCHILVDMGPVVPSAVLEGDLGTLQAVSADGVTEPAALPSTKLQPGKCIVPCAPFPTQFLCLDLYE